RVFFRPRPPPRSSQVIPVSLDRAATKDLRSYPRRQHRFGIVIPSPIQSDLHKTRHSTRFRTCNMQLDDIPVRLQNVTPRVRRSLNGQRETTTSEHSIHLRHSKLYRRDFPGISEPAPSWRSPVLPAGGLPLKWSDFAI